MNKSLFIKTIRIERKMMRLMNKDTSKHTLSKVVLNIALEKQMNLNCNLYECLDNKSLNELKTWAVMRMFKI